MDHVTVNTLVICHVFFFIIIFHGDSFFFFNELLRTPFGSWTRVGKHSFPFGPLIAKCLTQDFYFIFFVICLTFHRTVSQTHHFR